MSTADEQASELPPIIEPEDSGFEDNDDIASSTETLRSIVWKGKEERGRKYHGVEAAHGDYAHPEDEEEQDRLDLQSEIFFRAMGRNLYLAPVDCPGRVLDVGTGTGSWAIQFADDNSQSIVTGIDLSPIQPSWVPPNCKFEIADFNDDWNFTNKFNYIHGALLIGAIHDPLWFYRQNYAALEPGGWLERVEICLPKSDDNTVPSDCSLEKWCTLWRKAQHQIGRHPDEAYEMEGHMIEAGFKNVTKSTFKVPQNDWPKDEGHKMIGKLQYVNIVEGMNGFTMRLFTNVLGMTNEEVEALLAGVRADVGNRHIHAYWEL